MVQLNVLGRELGVGWEAPGMLKKIKVIILEDLLTLLLRSGEQTLHL